VRSYLLQKLQRVARRRCEVNIKLNIKETVYETVDWINLAQVLLAGFVVTIMKLEVL